MGEIVYVPTGHWENVRWSCYCLCLRLGTEWSVGHLDDSSDRSDGPLDGRMEGIQHDDQEEQEV